MDGQGVPPPLVADRHGKVRIPSGAVMLAVVVLERAVPRSAEEGLARMVLEWSEHGSV